MDIPTMALIVQTCGVVGTLIAATIAVRSYVNSNKKAEEAKQREQETRDRELETRQAQLFMQIYEGFQDKEVMKSLGRLLNQNKYVNLDFINWDESQEDIYSSFYSLANYFEGVGVLVKRKLIDPTLIDDLMSGAVVRIWELYGPNIVESRKRYNYPQLYEFIEYLYNSIKPMVPPEYNRS
jgi:hypothetical protein